MTQLVARYDQATISRINFDIWMNPYASTRLILKGSPQNKVIQNYMHKDGKKMYVCKDGHSLSQNSPICKSTLQIHNPRNNAKYIEVSL